MISSEDHTFCKKAADQRDHCKEPKLVDGRKSDPRFRRKSKRNESRNYEESEWELDGRKAYLKISLLGFKNEEPNNAEG